MPFCDTLNTYRYNILILALDPHLSDEIQRKDTRPGVVFTVSYLAGMQSFREVAYKNGIEDSTAQLYITEVNESFLCDQTGISMPAGIELL